MQAAEAAAEATEGRQPGGRELEEVQQVATLWRAPAHTRSRSAGLHPLRGSGTHVTF